MKSHYIFLPSNVKDPFEQNTTSNFITKLSSTMRCGEFWEVGLAQITFKKSWYNIKKDYSISLITETGQNFRFDDSSLKAGDYNNFDEIIIRINAEMISICGKIQSDTGNITERYPKATFDKFSRKISFTTGALYNGTKLLPLLDDELLAMFGFENIQNEANKYEPQSKNIEEATIISNGVIKGNIVSKRISDIDAGVSSLYVYCSIIKPSYVGDTLSKLIRVVQVPRCVYGEPVQKIYDIPHYFQLCYSEFDRIEISIRDDTGEPIEFNDGNVVVVLHLRENEFP